MKNVRDVLRSKGGSVWTTSPTTTVFEALKEMVQKDVGALLVVDGPELLGIFSERDYAGRSSS